MTFVKLNNVDKAYPNSDSIHTKNGSDKILYTQLNVRAQQTLTTEVRPSRATEPHIMKLLGNTDCFIVEYYSIPATSRPHRLSVAMISKGITGTDGASTAVN
jgi:hypothetical protein